MVSSLFQIRVEASANRKPVHWDEDKEDEDEPLNASRRESLDEPLLSEAEEQQLII